MREINPMAYRPRPVFNPQPYVRPPSLAMIPYTPPVSGWEFVKSEIIRGIVTGAIQIEQLYQESTPDLPPYMTLEMDSTGTLLKVGSVTSECKPTESHSAAFFLKLSGLMRDQTSKPRTRRQLNGDEIVEVLMGEAAFTTATDKKPMLATSGYASCVGVGGFDPINHIAFLVHFSMEQEVQPSGKNLFGILLQLAKKPFEKPLQIHLRTSEGYNETTQKTVQAVKKWMTSHPFISMELASEILDCFPPSDKNSLMIDARTGVVTEYHPSENSKGRELTPLDQARILSQAYGHLFGSNQGVDIVYQPG